ncbi:MAG: CHASE2 domain-containing protein [Rhodoferax sp.]
MQRPPLAGVAIALAVFLLVAGLRQLGGLQAAELVAGDLFLNLKPATDAQDARIAVVLIDDEDIRRLGRWPISDNMLADLIERLAATGPAGIGFDLYRDLPVAPGTERLERVLTDRRQVVFVMKFGAQEPPGSARPRAGGNGPDRVCGPDRRSGRVRASRSAVPG